ncbi:hypothetical protein D3C71_1438050 [compost metagenome]
MSSVHCPKIIIRAIAGKGGQDLNAHAFKIVLHNFLVALDIVLTDIVDHIVAGNFRFHRANLVINPCNIDLVVTARLARSREAGGVTDEDVHFRHFIHDFLRNCADIVPDQRCGAGLVDGHTLDIRECLERFDNVLLQQSFRTEDDMLLFNVSCEGVLELEIVIVTDIALRLPSVIRAPDWPVAHVNDVLHRRADHVLGSAIGATAFRDRAGNRVEIPQRKGIGQAFARTLEHGVLLSFGNAGAAVKKMMRHNLSSLLLV